MYTFPLVRENKRSCPSQLKSVDADRRKGNESMKKLQELKQDGQDEQDEKKINYITNCSSYLNCKRIL